MPSPHANESARINLRTSAEAKALIERAAALMGTTVSSFMLQNAYEAGSPDDTHPLHAHNLFQGLQRTHQGVPNSVDVLVSATDNGRLKNSWRALIL